LPFQISAYSNGSYLGPNFNSAQVSVQKTPQYMLNYLLLCSCC